MPSWPSHWISQALESARVIATGDMIDIMRAWSRSTPISPYSNNPIGMPAGTMGAKPYAGTQYAQFASIDSFVRAFAYFADSVAGRRLLAAMMEESPYGAAWREISRLGWPGSQTETDYPAALLDMTSDSYRASVSATPAGQRKTSGTVGAPVHVRSQVIEQARSTAQAAQAITDTSAAVSYLLRRHARNG